MQSPRVPSRYFPEGDVGSRANPITDPQDLMDMDLLHTRVNGDRHANGVIGGHTPASPVDRDHPLWRLNGGPASESSTAGRLGGTGMLGAGALGLRGAARMGFAASSMEPVEREPEDRLLQLPCVPVPTPVPDSASTRRQLLRVRRGLVPTEPLE